MPIPVEVLTTPHGRGPRRTDVIDYSNVAARQWLDKHVRYCLCNDIELNLRPAPGAPVTRSFPSIIERI